MRPDHPVRDLVRLDPRELLELDARARKWGGLEFSVLPDDADNSRELAEPTRLGLLSFSRDGYVREKAIRELIKIHDGSELPYLLIRLNDWVYHVRELAASAVRERVRPDYAEHFLLQLPLLQRLSHQQRGTPAPLVGLIHRLLAEHAGAGLRRLTRSDDSEVRRLAFELLFDPADQSYADIIQHGLDSSDTSVRLRAALRVREVSKPTALRTLLEQMTRDCFTPVRLQAVYVYLERLPDIAEAKLREMLLDRSAAVRLACRFYLGKRGADIDVPAIYRDAIARGDRNTLAAALSGLGEVGQPADAALLIPALKHDAPRVRRAAVSALARLDADANASHLITALSDSSPGVARAAASALLNRQHLLSTEVLHSLLEDPATLHARRLLLPLLDNRDWPTAVVALLRAVRSDDATVYRRANEMLAKRLRFHPPLTEDARAALLREFQAAVADGDLEPNVEAELRSALKPR